MAAKKSSSIGYLKRGGTKHKRVHSVDTLTIQQIFENPGSKRRCNLYIHTFHVRYMKTQYPHKNRVRYIHIFGGDETGEILIKAFESNAEKLKRKLERALQHDKEYNLLFMNVEICPVGGQYLNYSPSGWDLLFDDDSSFKKYGEEVPYRRPQPATLSCLTDYKYKIRPVSIDECLIVHAEDHRNSQLFVVFETSGSLVKLFVNGKFESAIPIPGVHVKIKKARVYMNGGHPYLSSKSKDIVKLENCENEEHLRRWETNQEEFKRKLEKILKYPYQTMSSLSIVKQESEKLKNGERLFAKVFVRIKNIRLEKESDFSYNGCTDDSCLKEMKLETKGGNTTWVCPKCGLEADEPKKRFHLYLQLGDDCMITEDNATEDETEMETDDYDEENGTSDSDSESSSNDEYTELPFVAFDEAAFELLGFECKDLLAKSPEERLDFGDDLVDTVMEMGLSTTCSMNHPYGPIIRVIQEVFWDTITA